MPRRTPRLHSLAALAILVAVTVGIPVLLIATAGWPLPRQIPAWNGIRTALQQGDIPAEVVINTLAVVVWIAWAQLVWALGWELAVNLPRTQNGEPAKAAPLVPAALGSGVGRLVAVLFAVGLSVATTPAPSLARPATPPAALVEQPATPTAAPSAAPTHPPATTSACWQVTEHDNLWDIAERSLGDGARATEILELNPAVRSARDLRAGQLLRLPDNAAVPADQQIPLLVAPAPSMPAPPAPSPGYLAEAVITIEAGDTLWDLSEARLLAANREPAGPGETIRYLDEVVAANPDTIENPDLIFAGDQFRFPAIGTPPPPPPPPTPSVDPPPSAPPAQPEAASPAPPTAPPPPAAATGPVSVAVPPVTAASSASAAPLSPSTSSGALPDPAKSASDDSSTPWLAGLAGATALASGLVLAYRRARNRAAAAGAANLRAGVLSQRGRQVERALVATSDLPLVRWANHELAALAARLDTRLLKGATPVAVEISESHGIELLWSSPLTSAPAPWEATDGGWSWRILYDPDVPVAATPEPAVLPGLVTIGQRDGRSVLVDLEALGSLAITGDPTAAQNLARSTIVELACGEDLANSYVHTVGIDLDDLPHLDRARVRDEPGAIELLQSVRADHDALLDRHRLETTFHLRLGGAAAGRELTVVAARADAIDDIDGLTQAAPPHRGTAVVILGEAISARATLEVDADGHAVLRPLGLTVTANQLPAVEVAEVAALMREAADTGPPSEPSESVNLPSAATEPQRSIPDGPAPVHEAEAFNVDECAADALVRPEVIVRTLGVPSVDGHPTLGRLELNLVTFLACSGGSATESQVIDAVWNGRAIERGTLWNRISKARAALGGFIPPRDQGSNLVRLAPDVTTDFKRLRDTVEQATQLSSAQAVDQLRTAMDLVSGVPFDAVGYDWAHEQQHYADACQLIERAALMLVDLALDLDDLATAKDAVSLGLKALRVNEPLYRARMRIEAHCGNRAGVRQAYDELALLLAELDDGHAAYVPTHNTTSLLEELLQWGRRTA